MKKRIFSHTIFAIFGALALATGSLFGMHKGEGLGCSIARNHSDRLVSCVTQAIEGHRIDTLTLKPSENVQQQIGRNDHPGLVVWTLDHPLSNNEQQALFDGSVKATDAIAAPSCTVIIISPLSRTGFNATIAQNLLMQQLPDNSPSIFWVLAQGKAANALPAMLEGLPYPAHIAATIFPSLSREVPVDQTSNMGISECESSHSSLEDFIEVNRKLNAHRLFHFLNHSCKSEVGDGFFLNQSVIAQPEKGTFYIMVDQLDEALHSVEEASLTSVVKHLPSLVNHGFSYIQDLHARIIPTSCKVFISKDQTSTSLKRNTQNLPEGAGSEDIEATEDMEKIKDEFVRINYEKDFPNAPSLPQRKPSNISTTCDKLGMTTRAANAFGLAARTLFKGWGS